VGLLVASAGFGTSGAFAEGDIHSELEMLDVNCRALLHQSWHFSRRFAERGRGGVILLSSIVAFQGNPWSANYSATKAYVQSLAEGLALEMASRGVDVLAVAPGPTTTGFASRAGMNMGKAMDPADLAQPILNSLGRRTTVLPGFLSKLLTYSLTTLPRWARSRVMGMVMKGMT
jgi:short-subunit dehydrogenase